MKKDNQQMARPGVTYLEVANAAQQIVAAGKFPTIEAIRAALGTGSNSTLGAHLRNWKAQSDQSQAGANTKNIPDELINALKGIWDRVNGIAEEKLQALELETQHDLALLNKEAELLQKEYVNAQQQNLELKHEVNTYAVQNATLEQAVAEYKIQIAALNEKQLSYQQQLEEKVARIDELHKQNQQIQANLEHYRTASQEQRQQDQQRYEQQQQQLEHTLQQTRQELTILQQDSTIWQQQLQQVQFAYDASKQELSNAKSESAHLANQLNELRIEFASKSKELDNLHTHATDMQTKLDAQQALQSSTQTQLAIAEARINDLKTEAEATAEQYKILLQQNWKLEQEKTELREQLKELAAVPQHSV